MIFVVFCLIDFLYAVFVITKSFIINFGLGTVYGRGCYFALSSSYSTTYAQTDDGGTTKCMFLAHVLTGDYCVGKSEMITPPDKPNSGTHPKKYDSTVNDTAEPTIFVVFKDSSVYPKYLITFCSEGKNETQLSD